MCVRVHVCVCVCIYAGLEIRLKVICSCTVSCESFFKLISSDEQCVCIFANHILN